MSSVDPEEYTGVESVLYVFLNNLNWQQTGATNPKMHYKPELRPGPMWQKCSVSEQNKDCTLVNLFSFKYNCLN